MSNAGRANTEFLGAAGHPARSEGPAFDPGVMARAKEQIEAWQSEHRDRAKGTLSAADSTAKIGPYVAITREVGAGGSQIAQMLGEALGWKVFDRQLLGLIN